MIEFDAQSSSSSTLDIGTFVGSPSIAADMEGYASPDTWNETHIRGWWPYSSASFFVSGTVEADPSASPSSAYLFCPIEEQRDASGNIITPPELDTGAFKWQGSANDKYGRIHGNKGLYGAVVSYVFTAQNSANLTHAVYVELYTRNNGDSVYGMAQVTGTSQTWAKRAVPALTWNSSANPHAPGVKLLVDPTTGSPGGIVISPHTSQGVQVDFTAGGGSALPANIRLVALRESAS